MRFRFILFLVFSFFAFQTIDAQEVNPISKKILAFCDANKGKKVGKGECWDLAKEALNSSGATWTPPYIFGKELGKKDVFLSGDIIQFEKVRIEYPDGAWKDIPHHTAIIYTVNGTNKFTIAEQNANGKRFVQFSEIDLSYIQKGKYTIFRPQ